VLWKHLNKSKFPSNIKAQKKAVLFVIYFDEAHDLTKAHKEHHMNFHLLGQVLSWMLAQPQFTVFLSTNSGLGAFAPSAVKHNSIQEWPNTLLHAPFTELPFDLFVQNLYGDLLAENLDGVTLDCVCQMETVVKFGHPL
jgi:hypothetical protein